MLGVCYYPEHWPETSWGEDARRMRELGIAWVRLGEFAWSRIEPARDDWRFDWLDRAVDTLSLDYGMSGDFATHYAWLPSGRWGLECLARLESVPVAGATELGRSRQVQLEPRGDLSASAGRSLGGSQPASRRVCRARMRR